MNSAVRGGRDLIPVRAWVVGYGHGSSPETWHDRWPTFGHFPDASGTRRILVRVLALGYARDEPLEARKCDGRAVPMIFNAPSKPPKPP